jgi:peptide-methionine (R)-S-oxide reductase
MDEEHFKKKLNTEQYQICRLKGTEAPFSGKYYSHKEKGTYNCVACGQELFSSEAKFESGSGWPSFDDPVNLENVEVHRDLSHGMVRTEVTCKNCNSHLGHVFDDGPTQTTGKRYCVNSCALDFAPKKEEDLEQ